MYVICLICLWFEVGFLDSIFRLFRGGFLHGKVSQSFLEFIEFLEFLEFIDFSARGGNRIFLKPTFWNKTQFPRVPRLFGQRGQ